MTDNNIIKALECCSNENTGCLDCSYIGKIGCAFDLRKDALDLINRQKAEIEKLNVELVGMRGACESYKMHYDNAQAEIERLNGISDRLNDICTNQDLEIERLKAEQEMADGYEDALVERTKSEAIKEFAERLKEKATSTFYEEHKYVDTEDIDNLVKEMTEVQE